MHYQVSRNGQMYGPYTLEDLRRYVASGHVLSTDLTKNDEMPEWVPVEQVLGTVGAAPVAAMAYAQPGTYAQVDPNLYPDAPNLAWGLVLLLGLVTCGLFVAVWNIVLSAWMKRVQPNSQAIVYYIAATIASLLNGGLSFGHFMGMHHHQHPHFSAGTGLLGVAIWVVRLVARFVMRASLEEHFNGPEPMGLRLSGVMTFFFGSLYFQYHLNRINEIKTALRYRVQAR